MAQLKVVTSMMLLFLGIILSVVLPTRTATGQPQPMIGDFNVTSIFIEEGEIEVQMDNSLDGYDESGASHRKNSPTLTLPTFTFSATKNKFVAVGCDT